MRYIAPLFIIAACTASNIYCMDSTIILSVGALAQKEALEEQRRVDADQELRSKWALAKLCHLQNVNPQELKVIGFYGETLSAPNKAPLQQALLDTLQAVTLEYSDKESTTAIVCIDIQKLVTLTSALEQFNKEEESLRQNKVIAEWQQKRKEVGDAYQKLLNVLNSTGTTEYWLSDLPSQNEKDLESLKQAAITIDAHLLKINPTGKRYDPNCLLK